MSAVAAPAAPSATAAIAPEAPAPLNPHRVDLSADEYFDVLNADGTPTGRTKLRAHVHRDGDWHASVHIWLLHSRTGEILLQLRAAHKDSFPSCWDVSCAGHLSAGESVMAACEAELGEELGLHAPAGVPFTSFCRPLCSLPREVISQGGRFIDREHTHCFLVEGDWDADKLQLQAEEVAGVKWMPVKELLEQLRKGGPQFVSYPDLPAYEQAVFSIILKRSEEIQAATRKQTQPQMQPAAS
jgi:isopentenyldiphosphate isomerase